MTEQQINYLNYLETKEYHGNLTAETQRHNQATEQYAAEELALSQKQFDWKKEYDTQQVELGKGQLKLQNEQLEWTKQYNAAQLQLGWYNAETQRYAAGAGYASAAAARYAADLNAQLRQAELALAGEQFEWKQYVDERSLDATDTKIANDYDLGLRELGIQQQDADTRSRKADSDIALNEAKIIGQSVANKSTTVNTALNVVDTIVSAGTKIADAWVNVKTLGMSNALKKETTTTNTTSSTISGGKSTYTNTTSTTTREIGGGK